MPPQTSAMGLNGNSHWKLDAVNGSGALEPILMSLHEAALDPSRWSNATALIDEALNTHGSGMVLADGNSSRDTRIHFAWCYAHGQLRRDVCREYFRDYYPQDERVARIPRLPDSQLFHAKDLFTADELKTSATYNELLVRTHGGNGITVRLNGPNGSHIVWGIGDPMDGDAWSSAQLDMIRRLLPHIRQTVSVQQELNGAGALGATLTEMLDATGLGVIQLDGRGRIAAANDRALGVLRTGNGLFDEGGSLFARTPEDDEHLQALLARALPPFGVQGAGGSTALSRSGGLPPLVLHVHPVGRQGTDFQIWPVAALVLIVDPANGTAIDPVVAARTLGLTRMEGRVAALLAEGLSVGEISEAAGRKESTIRSHVKHMLAKYGFSRQAELVRLVQSVAASPQARLRG